MQNADPAAEEFVGKKITTPAAWEVGVAGARKPALSSQTLERLGDRAHSRTLTTCVSQCVVNPCARNVSHAAATASGDGGSVPSSA